MRHEGRVSGVKSLGSSPWTKRPSSLFFGIYIADFHEIWQYWGWFSGSNRGNLLYFKRVIDFESTLARKSFFLLGPRQTGKSTLLKHRFPDAHYFDLLSPALYLKFKSSPNQFAKEIDYAYRVDEKRIFIIDEVQKLPELLDEVHRQIELHKDIRFILTGSSARKLKKAGINLLGGRAARFYLHPLVYPEFNPAVYWDNFEKNLTYGFLPSVLLSPDPWADLNDYVGLYLKEEIQQEAIARSLDGFSRFLNTVATTNAEQVNFTQVGNDAQVPPRTVREYYQVLEDTLIGRLVPAFTGTVKRKAMTSAKFYLFDPGVTNVLLGRKTVSRKTKEYGGLLEQVLFGELSAYFDYQGISDRISYWRSTSKFEVDFVVRHDSGQYTGIEIKSTSRPSGHDFKGLIALSQEVSLARKIVVCLADEPRLEDSEIEVLPVPKFLARLWQGAFFTE